MRHLIPPELCTRCGACYAADRLQMLVRDDHDYPLIEANADADEVLKLLSVCSGQNWNYRALIEREYGSTCHYDPSTPDIGHHIKIYLVTSSDRTAQSLGQSGGVTTSLLRHAFETKLIDAALVVRRPSAPDGNPFAAEPYIARTPDELHESYGSKYTICPTLAKIRQIASQSSAFAITTLPCQTVGFKRLVMSHDSSLHDKCKLIIGPLCGLNMEIEAAMELARASGINPEDVYRFQNRGGPFPGVTNYEMKDGTNYHVDRTVHRILYRMYAPLRCYTCTDYGNELADITAADCWERSPKGYKYPEGAAYLISRSKRGDDFVKDAIRSNVLLNHGVDPETVKNKWALNVCYRKVRAHNRIRYWEKRGKPVPDHDYDMPLPYLDSRLADKIDLTAWRILQHGRIRKCVLWLWVRLARAPKGSLRSMVYMDCKKFIFTHTYDQFRWACVRDSGRLYVAWVKSRLKGLVTAILFSPIFLSRRVAGYCKKCFAPGPSNSKP